MTLFWLLLGAFGVPLLLMLFFLWGSDPRGGETSLDDTDSTGDGGCGDSPSDGGDCAD